MNNYLYLGDCLVEDLHFYLNASMIALNLIKLEDRNQAPSQTIRKHLKSAFNQSS